MNTKIALKGGALDPIKGRTLEDLADELRQGTVVLDEDGDLVMLTSKREWVVIYSTAESAIGALVSGAYVSAERLVNNLTMEVA